MSDLVRRLSLAGRKSFAEYIEALRSDGTLPPPFQLLTDATLSADAGFAATVEREPQGSKFASRLEFGSYLVDALAHRNRADLSFDVGLWAWLALYYFDQLCPASEGRRKPEETPRYLLPERFQYNRTYRHLVRAPWLAYAIHGETSRVLLIPIRRTEHPLRGVGEIFAQVAGRQGVFRSRQVVAAVDRLYFDHSSGRPRAGAGGSEAGSPRRLSTVLKQFELTFDLESDETDLITSVLPQEFSRWQ